MTTRNRPVLQPFPELTRERTQRRMKDGRWIAREPPISLRGLDALIGTKTGTVAQLESGAMLPPDHDMCTTIDQALVLEPGTMWRHSAPARLRRFDPHVAEWHDDEVKRVLGFELSDGEQRLLGMVKVTQARLDRIHADHPKQRRLDLGIAMAALLNEFLNFVEDDAKRGDGVKDQAHHDGVLIARLHHLTDVQAMLPVPLRRFLQRAALNGFAEALMDVRPKTV